MKILTQRSDSTFRRSVYVIFVLIFILLWVAFALIGKYHIGWGVNEEYYGSMVLVFIWAICLRKRMENAGRQIRSLLPYMIGCLFLDFTLIKLNLIGLSASVLLGFFFVQLPAMFWADRRVAQVPGIKSEDPH
ncbi:MAG: hypothetical protein WB425_10985 [Terracidiphilus sp.]